jgi:hypothetical protein
VPRVSHSSRGATDARRPWRRTMELRTPGSWLDSQLVQLRYMCITNKMFVTMCTIHRYLDLRG